MADVFETHRADHGDVRLLLAALENSPGHAAGASQQVLKARKLAAERLVIHSARHEAAEEEYFWPTVRERLGDGSKLADEASVQEQAGREALARLDKLEPDDDEFDELLAELIPAARRNIEFEEIHVWPQRTPGAQPVPGSRAGRQDPRGRRPRDGPAAARQRGPGQGAQGRRLGGGRRGQAEQRGHQVMDHGLITKD